MSKDKIVLAYSGGLDTSITIPWLKENYDADIIAVCVDVGQKEDWEAVEKKAIASGASKFYNPHVADVLAEEYIYPAISSNLKYQGTYLLGTALARPLIAKELVAVAHKEGATAICHGCTGKGNDQVRFETGIAAFDPEMKIVAPWRIWDIKSREDALKYAELKGVPVTSTIEKIYSEDENLMHISHEGGDIESPKNAVDYSSILNITNALENTPDEAEIVEITFEQGKATAVNGEELKPHEVLETLNAIAGKHGIGVLDWIEDRTIGMKSRGIYETPGATLLMEAHERLESLTLTKETIKLKQHLAVEFAELIYNGQWYSMASDSILAFMNHTQKTVTGDVKLKLYKGNMLPHGLKSEFALFDEDVSGFGEDDLFDHHDAEGYINVITLPTKIQKKLGLL
ncbi:argininosuccinate synthase [Ruoffia tabacinasalis]|jgi:argininosuccinate synthase|uniref:Argininosuccinate synthase n=1 Tax=Ruoffia tabacinasalis TaxID=87458 RepID=A0ABS0LH53_9LACT|nr:argininosuccinate synthase [Ruoffia tabacinasalis]MBG9977499.1 argininosuccinate synthase [Ruoffia tabacinasalis]